MPKTEFLQLKKRPTAIQICLYCDPELISVTQSCSKRKKISSFWLWNNVI